MKIHRSPLFFLVLYVLAMLRPVLPVFEYVVNQDYISEYLCINKDKPMMNCDGKCYLSKMLQEDQNEKQQNLPPIDLREYPIGFIEILLIDFQENFYQKNELTYILEGKPCKFLNSIFHPPNC